MKGTWAAVPGPLGLQAGWLLLPGVHRGVSGEAPWSRWRTATHMGLPMSNFTSVGDIPFLQQHSKDRMTVK